MVKFIRRASLSCTLLLLVPVTSQVMVPPILKNSEQTRETFCSKWPTTVPSFVTATAYLSLSLVGSHLQVRVSPIAHNIPNSLINVISTYTTIFLKCNHNYWHTWKARAGRYQFELIFVWWIMHWLPNCFVKVGVWMYLAVSVTQDQEV